MYTLTIEYRDDMPTDSTLSDNRTEIVGTAADLRSVRLLTNLGRDRLHEIRRAGFLARYNVTHNG